MELWGEPEGFFPIKSLIYLKARFSWQEVSDIKRSKTPLGSQILLQKGAGVRSCGRAGSSLPWLAAGFWGCLSFQ